MLSPKGLSPTRPPGVTFLRTPCPQGARRRDVISSQQMPHPGVARARIGERDAPAAGLQWGYDRACRAASRSSNFWIFPVDVFGSGPKVTNRGHL